MIKLETDMARVKEIVTRPDVLPMVYVEVEYPDDYEPDPANYHFIVGNGLMIYEVKTPHCLELVTALCHDDIPDNPGEHIREQWKYLADKGYYMVYAIIDKLNFRANYMAVAMGMKRAKTKHINVFEKVIHYG